MLLISDIENDQRKAKLVAEVLQQKIANSPCPMPDEVMYDCQMLSEIVLFFSERANMTLRELEEAG